MAAREAAATVKRTASDQGRAKRTSPASGEGEPTATSPWSWWGWRRPWRTASGGKVAASSATRDAGDAPSLGQGLSQDFVHGQGHGPDSVHGQGLGEDSVHGLGQNSVHGQGSSTTDTGRSTKASNI